MRRVLIILAFLLNEAPLLAGASKLLDALDLDPFKIPSTLPEDATSERCTESFLRSYEIQNAQKRIHGKRVHFDRVRRLEEEPLPGRSRRLNLKVEPIQIPTPGSIVESQEDVDGSIFDHRSIGEARRMSGVSPQHHHDHRHDHHDSPTESVDVRRDDPPFVKQLPLEMGEVRVGLILNSFMDAIDRDITEASIRYGMRYASFVRTEDAMYCSAALVYKQDALQDTFRGIVTNYLSWYPKLTKAWDPKTKQYVDMVRTRPDHLYVLTEFVEGNTLLDFIDGLPWFHAIDSAQFDYSLFSKARQSYDHHGRPRHDSSVEDQILRSDELPMPDQPHQEKPNLDFLRSVLVQILSSLWYAYEKTELRHGDLHLGNIMVTYDRKFASVDDWTFNFIGPNVPRDSDGSNRDMHPDPSTLHPHSPTNSDGSSSSRLSFTGSVKKKLDTYFEAFLRKSAFVDKRDMFEEESIVQEDDASQSEISTQAWRRAARRARRLREIRLQTLIDFYPDPSDTIDPSLYMQFSIPSAASFKHRVTIIDFGLSSIDDPNSGKRIHSYRLSRSFNPLADLRTFALYLIRQLPLATTFRSFLKGTEHQPWHKEFRKEIQDFSDVVEIMFDWGVPNVVADETSRAFAYFMSKFRARRSKESEVPISFWLFKIAWILRIHENENREFEARRKKEFKRGRWTYANGPHDGSPYHDRYLERHVYFDDLMRKLGREENRPLARRLGRNKIFKILNSPFFVKFRNRRDESRV